MIVEVTKFILLFLLGLFALYLTAKVITMGIMKGYFEAHNKRRECNGDQEEKERC